MHLGLRTLISRTRGWRWQVAGVRKRGRGLPVAEGPDGGSAESSLGGTPAPPSPHSVSGDDAQLRAVFQEHVPCEDETPHHAKIAV